MGLLVVAVELVGAVLIVVLITIVVGVVAVAVTVVVVVVVVVVTVGVGGSLVIKLSLEFIVTLDLSVQQFLG